MPEQTIFDWSFYQVMFVFMNSFYGMVPPRILSITIQTLDSINITIRLNVGTIIRIID